MKNCKCVCVLLLQQSIHATGCEGSRSLPSLSLPQEAPENAVEIAYYHSRRLSSADRGLPRGTQIRTFLCPNISAQMCFENFFSTKKRWRLFSPSPLSVHQASARQLLPQMNSKYLPALHTRHFVLSQLRKCPSRELKADLLNKRSTMQVLLRPTICQFSVLASAIPANKTLPNHPSEFLWTQVSFVVMFVLNVPGGTGREYLVLSKSFQPILCRLIEADEVPIAQCPLSR